MTADTACHLVWPAGPARSGAGWRNLLARIIISLVLLAAGALGDGFPPDLPAAAFWGRAVAWSGVRDIVPGVVGFEPGASELFLRPARLGFINRGGFEVGGGSRMMSEQRTRFVYDQFENAIGEIVVADNLSGSWYAGPAAAAYRVAEPVVVAAGIRPVTDYKYDYYKEYRDDFYVVIGTDRVSAEGLLYEATAAAAVRPVSWLSVGVSGGYRFGNRRIRIETMRVGDSTAYYDDEGAPRGVGFAAGLTVEPLAGLRLDAGFDGGTRLTEWRRASGEEVALDRSQPWQARIGVAWLAAGVLPSRVSAEAGYVGWTGVDSSWTNLLSVRGGVEHSFVNGLRLSYGAGVEPLPFAPHIHRVLVGGGLGWDAGPVRLDAGVSFGREIIGPSEFPAGLNPTDQRVYQTGTVFGLGVSRSF